MKKCIELAVWALVILGGIGLVPCQAADRTPIILGTATPGGGFELYGGALAEVVNSTDSTLKILARNTRGSRQNIPLLEQGTLGVFWGHDTVFRNTPACLEAGRILLFFNV